MSSTGRRTSRTTTPLRVHHLRIGAHEVEKVRMLSAAGEEIMLSAGAVRHHPLDLVASQLAAGEGEKRPQIGALRQVLNPQLLPVGDVEQRDDRPLRVGGHHFIAGFVVAARRDARRRERRGHLAIDAEGHCGLGAETVDKRPRRVETTIRPRSMTATRSEALGFLMVR